MSKAGPLENNSTHTGDPTATTACYVGIDVSKMSLDLTVYATGKLTEVGRVVGLKKYSSVSTAYLRMNAQMAKEQKLRQQDEQIAKQLLKSQEQCCPLFDFTC